MCFAFSEQLVSVPQNKNPSQQNCSDYQDNAHCSNQGIGSRLWNYTFMVDIGSIAFASVSAGRGGG